jgi:hypothetical protein
MNMFAIYGAFLFFATTFFTAANTNVAMTSVVIKGVDAENGLMIQTTIFPNSDQAEVLEYQCSNALWIVRGDIVSPFIVQMGAVGYVSRTVQVSNFSDQVVVQLHRSQKHSAALMSVYRVLQRVRKGGEFEEGVLSDIKNLYDANISPLTSILVTDEDSELLQLAKVNLALELARKRNVFFENILTHFYCGSFKSARLLKRDEQFCCVFKKIERNVLKKGEAIISSIILHDGYVTVEWRAIKEPLDSFGFSTQFQECVSENAGIWLPTKHCMIDIE